MQSLGCFHSFRTTPSNVLAKLILEATGLLENYVARADGIVCNDALGILSFSG
jgi:hypothetical protein